MVAEWIAHDGYPVGCGLAGHWHCPNRRCRKFWADGNTVGCHDAIDPDAGHYHGCDCYAAAIGNVPDAQWFKLSGRDQCSR